MLRPALFSCLMHANVGVHASFGPLAFLPPNPTTADLLRFRVQTRDCDTFLSNSDSVVQIQGSVIRVTRIGISVDRHRSSARQRRARIQPRVSNANPGLASSSRPAP